jgi:membrane protease YdiL (CAAX protease family)
LLPIGIVSWIWGKENKIFLWPVIIISSVIFGLIHGSWRNIFLQGSVGIVLSMAFLKGGYVSSVVAHFFCNFLLALVGIIIKILFFS